MYFYSSRGRGRGRGYHGRGRGRGSSAGRAMTWVRPRGSDASTLSQCEATADGSASSEKEANKKTRNNSQTGNLEKTTGPILRGPENQRIVRGGRGRIIPHWNHRGGVRGRGGVPPANKTWRRVDTELAKGENLDVKKKEGKKFGDPNTASGQEHMAKRAATISSQEVGEISMGIETGTTLQEANQLNIDSLQVVDTKNSKSKMIYKGSNKMVLAQPSNTETARNGGRSKRPLSPPIIPTVKRIRINNASSREKMSEISIQDDVNDKKPKGKDPIVETLTDFAYRETSTVHSIRGRGGRPLSPRGGYGHRVHKNMGLVRVNPDETKSPICPTFLRGIRCENEMCTKRHDVPIESAKPVCLFFQRHGQCLKGSECPFRHVKVNPRATLCPSFNLLGYCEDEKCEMKHVAVNKSRKSGRK